MITTRRRFLQVVASAPISLGAISSISSATTPPTTKPEGNAVSVEMQYPLTFNANDLCLPTTTKAFEQNSDLPLVAELNGNFIDVNQLIEAEAIDPFEMFKFSPSYIEIDPGDTVRFLNSMGQHTVVSIKDMLPDGAKPFEISHQKVAEVRFDHPGVYGIRCKVHTRYGMVMLIKVGDKLANLDQARNVKHGRMAKKRFKQLFAQLDKTII